MSRNRLTTTETEGYINKMLHEETNKTQMNKISNKGNQISNYDNQMNRDKPSKATIYKESN